MSNVATNPHDSFTALALKRSIRLLVKDSSKNDFTVIYLSSRGRWRNSAFFDFVLFLVMSVALYFFMFFWLV